MMEKQKITANGVELFVDGVVGKRDVVDGVMYELLELQTNEPLSKEAVDALKADSAWVLHDYDETPYVKDNYTNLLRCVYMFAQVDPNEVVIREKEAELQAMNALVAETAAQVAEKEAQVSALEHKVTAVATTLLRGATREKAMPLAEYIPDWAPGPFEEGDIRKDEGQVYQLIAGKAHDATNQPDWRPSQQPSLWFLWHGISRETAMPFVPVTGAHDMYKKGEWMILEDEYYEAIEDTAYSPKDYAGAWKKG